jgi:amino acid adenylation domain-containing protein
MIFQLIKAQALADPNALAICDEHNSITYSELDIRSNQLASYLQALGLKKGSLVGIAIGRTIEVVIGVLATLKAGGAYVPLDPDYPRERIQYMMRDSGLSILLTQQKELEKFSFFHGEKVCLDTDFLIDSYYPGTILENTVNENDLAYVLYTSGSTGNPKGVMIKHRSLVYAYRDWKDIYHLDKNDRHLQMASFSFDVFTGDLVRSLCSGSSIFLCPRYILSDPEKLYKLITDEKITCAEFVPSILRRLIDYLKTNKKSLEHIRLLICGSDNWSMHEYRAIQDLCGSNTRVISSYGATEATIDSTYFESNCADLQLLPQNHSVPLGKPFPHTKIFILDERLQPVQSNMIGEIYIAGESLAKGYLNRDYLTEQKFIMVNVSEGVSLRAYKTGDQGRFMLDRNIEFLGRIDNQVKIRGMRVELSDIENVLNSCHLVKESLVIVSDDKLIEKSLMAFVVPKDEIIFDMSKVRYFIFGKLPKHMIPSFFIQIEALPLTPNGKLDRRALINHKFAKNDRLIVQPKDDIEDKILHIWEKVLPHHSISVRDNFFECGGNSLLFFNLIKEVELTFNVNLNFQHCESYLTIEGIADSVKEQLEQEKNMMVFLKA